MMALFNRRLFTFVVLAGLVPAVASAQDLRRLHRELSRTSVAPVARVGVAPGSGLLSHSTLERAATRMQAERWSGDTPQDTTPRRHVMGFAIAVGIGAGVGIAGLAASKYGENESGAFCAQCFAQWSAIAVPIGAGAGAVVGYLMDRARR